MWPFDKLLYSRVQNLERTVEVLTGANGVLERELERSRNQEQLLLAKIFEFTGLNKTSQGEVGGALIRQEPIKIGNKGIPWPKIKEELEIKAKREYWENKQKQKEQIEKIEKEILSGNNDGEVS